MLLDNIATFWNFAFCDVRLVYSVCVSDVFDSVLVNRVLITYCMTARIIKITSEVQKLHPVFGRNRANAACRNGPDSFFCAHTAAVIGVCHRQLRALLQTASAV